MKKPLRALLLAAGLGTRLRPLTLTMPKCLVQISGEPLLARWLKNLEKAGCESVLINTHYLNEQVEAFLKNWNSPNMRIETTFEPTLLGTAGTLIRNQDFFTSATGLLIHADNAMAGDLNEFLLAHQNRPENCLLTMMTFNTDSPSSCGIVEIDSQSIVHRFHEKVPKPPSNRANGAIYAFDQPMLDHINRMTPPPSDYSKEVIPSLLGHIHAWHTNQIFLDIGTPKALATAQKLLRL